MVNMIIGIVVGVLTEQSVSSLNSNIHNYNIRNRSN